MNTETSTPLSTLLSAAREVMKPRWPKPDVIAYHLPGERDVSRTPTRILWPGYKERMDLHGILYFRAGTIVAIENAEHLEPMLDSKSLLAAARECSNLAAKLDGMAQTIRDRQKAELACLVEEASALVLAGLANGLEGAFFPLLPVVHRMLTTTYAPPDAIRKLASDIIMRRHPLNVRVESRPESTSHSIDITVFQAGDASLHMLAEVHRETARISWQVVTQSGVRLIRGDASGAIAVGDVCRTPHEALTLKMRLDTIIPYCRGER